MLTFPLRTRRGLNDREHYMQRARRVKAERAVTAWNLASLPKPIPPLVVTLTRIGPSNGLDDDGLAGSLKAVRDEFAAWVGVDDRKREVVRYQYEQERGKEWAVRIEWRPM